MEKAAAELVEEEWQRRSAARLPQATDLEAAMNLRLGWLLTGILPAAIPSR